MKTLTGDQVVSMMRKHHITIRRAAALFDITHKRVRQVRSEGVRGDVYVWEWSEWLPTQHHTLNAQEVTS